MKSTSYKCMAVIVALCLAGCSIMQPIPGGEVAWRNSIQAGDTVTIQTVNGKTLEFEVAEVTDTGLRGEGQAVSYEVIASVEKHTLSTWRTVGLVLGILAAGALLGGDSYDSSSYGSGGGSGGGVYTPP